MKKIFWMLLMGSSAMATSSLTDKQLANCLLNIAESPYACRVTLDENDPAQRELAQLIKNRNAKGITAFIPLMDARGTKYSSWEEYEQATQGRTYLAITFNGSSLPHSYQIVTAVNEGEISMDRRDNDFRYAIDSLNRSLLSDQELQRP